MPNFVPGPAITDGRDLDGRAALVDELLRLTAARTPTALLGPRRAGKTSVLHTLAVRLRGTHEVHHATLEGAQLASRDDLARRLAPPLATHPAPAEGWAELPALAPATLLAHLDQLPRLDDLTIDAADAVLGAGLVTPAGIWLDDIPWFQWVRLHAKRLARAEGA